MWGVWALVQVIHRAAFPLELFAIQQSDGLAARLFRDGNVCGACRRIILQRRHASAMASTVQSTDAPIERGPPTLSSVDQPPFYRINAGVLLCRPPLITRLLTPFERAYFFYQRRLNERLSLPFTRYFYVKDDTPAELEWKRKMKERHTAAADLGMYSAYSNERWNDELLLDAKESEVEHQVDALLKDAEGPASSGDTAAADARKEKVPRPLPRVTEADRAGDETKLDRRLDRTLYLIVKESFGHWRFPTAELRPREALHGVSAAEPQRVQGNVVIELNSCFRRLSVYWCTLAGST